MSFGTILYTIFIQPLQLIFEIIFKIANDFIGHPGLAIIVLSLIMNFLVLPLYKRADDMQERQRLTEERLKKGMDHIKKVFSGDERMMMLQVFYKQNNYKPTSALSGSVSLLLQIPFFMAAYNFLSNLQILNGVSLGPIKNLGVPDAMFTIAGFDINVLPILMTAINVIASAIYLKGHPLKTKIQLYAMAAFFLVFLYTSPAGLVFYWTLNNVFSLGKNCFNKLENPGQALKILAAAVGVYLLGLGGIFYQDPSLKKRLIILIIGVALLVPFAATFFKNKIKIKVAKTEATPNKKVFVLGALVLSAVVGLLIPSTILGASPQEFIDINYFHNPLWYLVSSFCLAFGTFMVWFGVFYWLASPKGKAMFDKLVWILCGVMTANYMFFGTDLGILKSNLQYETGLDFTLVQQLINLGVIAVLAVVLYFVVTKFKKIVPTVLLTAFVAVVAMSGYNVYNTVPQVESAEKKAQNVLNQDPSFSISKDGKNVAVIMLDRAMGQYVPYIFNEVPELKEQFAGFTYYSNTISFGGNTNFGVPALYGGYEYTPVEMNERDDEKLVDKHNEALKVLPVLYDQNGYDVTVCDPPYANYEWIPDLSIYDEYENIDAYVTDGYFSNSGAALAAVENNHRNFFCFSIMKTMPLLLQETIYDLGNYNKADETIDPVTSSYQTATDTSNASGIHSKFMTAYEVLLNMNNMTEIKESGDTFLFFSSNATHEPMLMQKPDYTPSGTVNNTAYDVNNEELYTLNGHTLKMDTVDRVALYHSNVATYKQLGEWFDYLREQGVYDNTKIILVADHGGAMRQMDELVHSEEWNVFKDVEGFYPMLMVKDFGATEFTESKEFMTNADVPTLAVKDTIENPVNPFTNKEINNDAKDEGVYIITSNDWDVTINNGNQFLPAYWATVKDDIWVKENWSFIETNTTDPRTVE